MRTSSKLLSLFAVAALAACATKGPSTLGGTSGSADGEGGGEGNGGTIIDDTGVHFAPATKDALSDRKVDYNEALRTASLKLVSALPTLTQIKHVAGASDQKAAYEQELDAMLADERFTERMIKWWKDVMRVGGGAHDDKPSRDTAPTFAARVVVEDRPFGDLFTAQSGTCPTYDSEMGQFADGDCDNGAPQVAGVLTDPGVMYQFYGSMAFRRVRWVQEIFVCTKFPAEYSETPVHMGAADYTSPWPFGSVATAPIDFQDTQSVICANCHTTINHIAPLFGNFDDSGVYRSTIQVMTPLAPKAIPTELSHWLTDGSKTYWRNGQEAADLGALGKAVAADPDVAECAVARAWNFVMSKEDIVTDLATVPSSVLAKSKAEFSSNGQNFKKTLRAMFASEDFVSF